MRNGLIALPENENCLQALVKDPDQIDKRLDVKEKLSDRTRRRPGSIGLSPEELPY